MTIPGTLYIISAPSGGGKTSLVNALLESVDNLAKSISHTTRLQRPSEQNDSDYHFISETEFQKLLEQQVFLEHAHVFGNYYGTSKIWVDEQLKKGVDIVLDIDWQGARQIKQLMPESIGVFVLPPSWQALEQRLRARAQDSETVIQQRMAQAKQEISHYEEYDYLIVNDNFAKALADLQAIIHVRRLRKVVQKIELTSLLKDLLV
jgi:guanylate kinase